MSAAPFALELLDVKKYFGGLFATQGVTLRIPAGERRLLMGPNGAGKTTLFNQITGDLLPTSGSIRLHGEDITRLQPHLRARLGLARTYQIITLFAGDTIEHNIMLALLGLSPSRLDMLRPLASHGGLRDQIHAFLDAVGLAPLAKRRVGEIGYGEKRRVEIAMAIAQKPRVLLLDEPLAGLSTEERGVIKRLIAGISRETTIVMIEHDMDTALDLADAVTLLHYGKVIVDGTRDAVVADPRTREIYLGH